MSLSGPMRGPLRKKESHQWEREALDHYVEPAWCSERLFEDPVFEGVTTVVDPSCGFGTIVESASQAGFEACGSDLIPRWEEQLRVRCGAYEVSNFLDPSWPGHVNGAADAIVSNPPFKHALDYAELALSRSSRVVALLLPANWIQGQRRSRWLSQTPLYKVLFICPRPSMPPGHVILAGGKPGNGTTDYAWFVWLKGYRGAPQVGWLYRDGEIAA